MGALLTAAETWVALLIPYCKTQFYGYIQNLAIGKVENWDLILKGKTDKWNDFVSGACHWHKLVLTEYRWDIKQKLTEPRNDSVGLWFFFAW